MCPSSSTRRYWPPGAALALAHISAVGFHTQKCVRPRTHTHTHTLQAPVAMPCSCLYTSLRRWEWVCLENMSSVDARRLFSCQKILFTFHFYTAPQPHSGAFSSLLHFQKTCSGCTRAFPLSISLSDSNQPADLRADSNKYTLTVVSTSPALSCFWAFAGVRRRTAPHETCLIEGILLDYLT